jgi:hypothetical protein
MNKDEPIELHAERIARLLAHKVNMHWREALATVWDTLRRYPHLDGTLRVRAAYLKLMSQRRAETQYLKRRRAGVVFEDASWIDEQRATEDRPSLLALWYEYRPMRVHLSMTARV